MDILDRIESKHYVANEAQIEGLAGECYKAGNHAQRTDGIYLRVLIAGCQAVLGAKRGRAPNVSAQLAVVEQVHEKYYAAVLRGVTTPDVANEATLEATERNRRSLERNRRSNFARQSKSTLAAYATGGGDIRAIEVSTVTKGSLRAATRTDEEGDEAENPIARSRARLEQVVLAQAKVDPGGARAALKEAIEALQKVLDSLDGEPDHESTTTVVARGAARGHARTRVGVPQLHRSA